jgi:hypothetical protein
MPELSVGNWIALVSALTALISVIVGPLVSWRVAEKQIRASVVSENRQDWINTLRNNISEFQAKAKIATVEARLASDPNSSFAADPDSHNNAMKALTLLANRIKLLINPTEEDHARLVTCVEELLEFCSDGEPNDVKRHQELQNRITSVGQRILKREWERVKNVE